ncbi:Palmitoyltransferase Zdhhc20 [Manis pentadactyla]|nr:Palmitoyltransferase Zdhhc20 [Manis pentadactyla]
MAPWTFWRCCQRTVGWVPVLFITCVGVWSYYAYVVELCFCNFSSLDIACSQLFLFDEVNETHDWLVSLLTFNRASLCHHAYLLKLILRFGEN